MKRNISFWLMMLLLMAGTIGLHLLSHGESVPLETPLKGLSTMIGDWAGVDAPIEPRILQALGLTDYVSRNYRHSGKDPILLYVGYYKSQRTGQQIHSPKNCLPAGGWEPTSASRIEINLPNEKRAQVNYYVIENGLQHQAVLYWYQSHGRVVASEYWGKAYMISDALRLNRTDAALVRVSMPFRADPNAARDQLLNFVQLLLPQLNKLLPN